MNDENYTIGERAEFGRELINRQPNPVPPHVRYWGQSGHKTVL